MSDIFHEKNDKKLGFGLMRLPQADPNDWMYCGFQSESVAKEALVAGQFESI